MAASTKLRALCLHGWRTNAQVMKFQMSGLEYVFGGNVEFIFLEGPHSARGPAMQDVIEFFGEGEYYEWWNSEKNTQTDEVYFEGVDESIAKVEAEIQEKGPFDFVVGFSQGAMLTTIMNSLYQTKRNMVFPWKMSILVSGTPPRDKTYLDPMLKTIPLKIPSIHVIGEQDFLVKYSKILETFYESKDRSTFIHPEGHKFPNPVLQREMYNSIKNDILRVCVTQTQPTLSNM